VDETKQQTNDKAVKNPNKNGYACGKLPSTLLS